MVCACVVLCLGVVDVMCGLLFFGVVGFWFSLFSTSGGSYLSRGRYFNQLLERSTSNKKNYMI